MPVRRSSAIAFGLSWGVFLCVTFYAWERVLSVPDGRGDIRGLLVATVAGSFGLAFIGAWVQDRERDR